MIITREEDLVFFERIEDDSLNDCEEEKKIYTEDPDEADIAHDLQMIGECNYE